MKKLTVTLAPILACLVLFSCGEKAPTPEIPENEIENKEEAPDTGNESPTPSQTPEEDKEADKNHKKVYAVAKDNMEIDYTIDGTGFAVFHIPTSEWTGDYGIVDMEGNIIVEPTYNLMGWCDWHKVIYAEPFPEGTEPIFIDDTHKIDLHYGHGGEGEFEYIFSKKDGKYYTCSSMYGDVSIGEFTGDEIPEFTPYIITEAGLTPGYFSIGEYAPITDYMMEEYHTYAFTNDRGAEVVLGQFSKAQNRFVNDYMPVQKDGKWAYVNILGETVTDFIYDGATNAFDNKAWVKQDGTWQVIGIN